MLIALRVILLADTKQHVSWLYGFRYANLASRRDNRQRKVCLLGNSFCEVLDGDLGEKLIFKLRERVGSENKNMQR